MADAIRIISFDDNLTDVEEIKAEQPTSFALNQNYPNPFNPSTSIEFSLKNRQNISLSVYDILGRKISVLAHGEFSQGNHRIHFDGKDLSSGIYIYTLSTQSGSLSKSMLLLK